MNPRGVVIECRAAGHPHETQVFVAGERRLAVPLYGTKSLARRVVAYFLYDGRQLEVSAAIDDVAVVVDHARVGGSWTKVPIPSVLKAGADTFDVRFSEEEPMISSARAVARACATTTPDVTSTLVSASFVSVALPASSSTPAPGPAPPRAPRRLLALAVRVFVASAALTTLALVIHARAPARVGAASVTTPAASVPVPAPRTSAAVTVAPLASGAGTLPLGRATERRAIDLVAQGAFVEAAPLYRLLARQHPDRSLFAEAAAHVERRAVERHGAKSAK